MRIERALDRFTTQLRADGRSDHTIKQYARHVRLLASWLRGRDLPDDVAAVTHETVAAFLVSDAVQLTSDGGRTRKPTSANGIRTSIRNLFGYLHRAGEIRIDPTRLVRRARCSPPPPRALTDHERDQLLRALDDLEAGGTGADRRDAALFRLMLGTGIRIGSAIALDVSDLDLDAGVVHVGQAKGGRPYRAFVPRELVGALRRHLGDRTAGPVFQGRGGDRITARHAQRRFARILEKGLGGGGADPGDRATGSMAVRPGVRSPRTFGTHVLRHTRATDLYRKTGDLLVVKELLGHRSVASTLVYARADEARLRAAAGA